MKIKHYSVSLDWFNGDDTDETEVMAYDLDDAARVVWAHWSRTGWTGASVQEGGRILSLNLDAATFAEALWDSDASTQ